MDEWYLLFSARGFSSMKAAVLFTDADAGDVEETAPFTHTEGIASRLSVLQGIALSIINLRLEPLCI